MKKARVFLHIILVIAIVVGIVGLMWVIDGTNKNYMSKEKADNHIADAFYEDASEILENVGVIAEFNDQYGDDNIEIPNTNGQTVGQLKQEYQTNSKIIEEDRQNRDKIFYYREEDVETDEEEYFCIDDMYYSAEEIEKYGRQSYEEYENEEKYYQSRIDFFESYENVRNVMDENAFTENLGYYIYYTDQSGKLTEYYSDGGKAIVPGISGYNSYFLFDRKNNTSLMENLDKTYAGYETLVYKCKTFTDYEDFYAVFAINENYPFDDLYSYYGKEVITDSKKVAEYETHVAMACGAWAAAFFILMALFILTGRTDNKTTKLYVIDYLWWDISIVVLIAIYGIILAIFGSVEILELQKNSDYQYFGIYLFAVIESSVIYMLSVIRRFKAKCFIRTSLLGLFFIKVVICFKKLWQYLDATKKAVICAVVTFVYMLAVCFTFVNGVYYDEEFFTLMWFLLAVGLLAVVFFVVWKFHMEYDSIAEKTRNIASGDINNKIDIPLRFKSNRKMASAVNHIGEGISKAVEASVKNERMKTDLITNVSHDIKTPLTSIINYVNLLKMEETGDEKINNYIKILDEKSQRLKSLTDDLVEASKLSSGVIELQFQKLNLVELIKQSAGEYEERFDEKYLEIIMNLPVYPVYVKADGRKMWRVLENLYGNIYKYAMKGTRVYVDLSVVNQKVILCVKNISNSPLNFESNELTERFIRGDVSRSTEGSGLGLSIAKSIIDRHQGEFKIVLDGDLFKVVIKLDEYSEKEEVEENPNENQRD